MKRTIAFIFCAVIATMLFVSCGKNETENPVKPLPPTPDTVEWPSDIRALYECISNSKDIITLTIKTVSAKEMQTILDDTRTILIGNSGILCIYIKNGEATIATTAKKIIMPASSWTFDSMRNMTSLNGLELLDYSNTTSMFSLFQCCEKIQSLDLSSLNTKKVKDVTSMFEFCYELKSIKFGDNFNLDNVNKENLRYMFWVDKSEAMSNPMNIIGCPETQKNTIKTVWVDCKRPESALSFDGRPAFEN